MNTRLTESHIFEFLLRESKKVSNNFWPIFKYSFHNCLSNAGIAITMSCKIEDQVFLLAQIQFLYGFLILKYIPIE